MLLTARDRQAGRQAGRHTDRLITHTHTTHTACARAHTHALTHTQTWPPQPLTPLIIYQALEGTQLWCGAHNSSYNASSAAVCTGSRSQPLRQPGLDAAVGELVAYGVAAPIDFRFKIFPDLLVISESPGPEVSLYEVLSPGFVVLVTGGMADGAALEVMLAPEDGLVVRVEIRDADTHEDISSSLTGDVAQLITQNSAEFDDLAVRGVLPHFYFKFVFDYGESSRACNVSLALCPDYCCTRSARFHIPYQLRASAPCFDFSAVFRVRDRNGSRPWPSAAAVTASEVSWARVEMALSSSSPNYISSGGPLGNGHLQLRRSYSHFLDAGAQNLDIGFAGGLTVVALLKFTGEPGFNETGGDPPATTLYLPNLAAPYLAGR